jgi:Na+/proline symporter
MALILFVVISAYLILIGFKSMKSVKTVEDYFLFDGKLKYNNYIGTVVASNLSLGNFIFIAAIWGYLFGIGGIFWMIFSVLIFGPLFYYFTPNFKTYIEDNTNAGSVHEYLALSYAKSNKSLIATKIRLIASLSTIICLMFALAIEINLASYFLQPLLNIDLELTFIILTTLLCFYTATGGFRAVVVTDLVQAVIMFICIVIIAYVMYEYYSKSPAPLIPLNKIYDTSILGMLKAPGFIYIFSFLFMNANWFIVTMDTFQRNCATRSLDTSLKGMGWSLFLIAIAIGFFAFMGMYVRIYVIPNLNFFSNPDNPNPILDFMSLQTNETLLSIWGVGLTKLIFGMIAIGIVMAGISTADTFLLVCGHSFVTDLLIGAKKKANFSELNSSEKETFTNIGRGIIIFLSVGISIIWGVFYYLGLKDPLVLFYLAYSIQFSLLIPILYSASPVEKNKPYAAYYSILAGVIASLVFGSIFTYNSVENFIPLSILSPPELVATTPILTVFFSFITFKFVKR